MLKISLVLIRSYVRKRPREKNFPQNPIVILSFSCLEACSWSRIMIKKCLPKIADDIWHKKFHTIAPQCRSADEKSRNGIVQLPQPVVLDGDDWS